MTDATGEPQSLTRPFRAGLLIPSSNTTIEPEYYSLGPWQVSWHFARLTMTRVDEAGLREQDKDIDLEAGRLGAANPHVVLFCQSAASFIMGRDYDADLKARIGAASGAPVLVAGETMVDLLSALGVKRLALATPFTDAVNEKTTSYFQGAGFEVAGVSGLGIVTNFDIAALDEEKLVALVKSVDRPDAEAIVMPGGNMPCLGHMAAMEAAVNKPVVTTNLAGMWSISKLLGFRLSGARFARVADA
jgi:maleate isomerase